MIFLEGGFNGSGIMILVLSILLGPPILLSLIGFLLRKNYKTASKVFFILAVVYLLVGLGTCFGGF